MNNYELLYIVSNQYTDDEAKKIKERIDEVIKSFGGIIGSEEDMGKKKLAYPINQVAHGYYFLTEFELEDGPKLKDINNLLRLDKEILRAQIINKPKPTAKQLEKIRKQEAYRAKTGKAEDKPIKPETEKKVDIKNLDEKLDEILKTDDLV
jgi:small subunit ribosomal protein S6